MVVGTTEETFIQIEVRNPRTHISREKALYTDYEIVVKTNNIAFACNESSVRRRYSDFQWLRTRLINQYQFVTSPPELPPKRLFGRFQRQFLKRRQAGLQKFLTRVVEDNHYLSDVAIHLFLQSSLPIKEIERYLDGMVSDVDIMDTIQSPGRSKPTGLSRSMAEFPHFEAPLEHDSGCCYSTTSSINDLMHTSMAKTQETWRYYMSVPANLDKVAAHESDEPVEDSILEEPGQMMTVDSGHLTSGSQQSLHGRTVSSESECDDEYRLQYDADDEGDSCTIESSVGSIDCVFLSKVFPIEKALQVLITRPKISERILAFDDDTDEEFHESEYDVIESDNDELTVRIRRKSSASSKKKLSRSFSDVKLKRKSSQATMNIEKDERRSSFQSMPNINAMKRSRKQVGGLYLKGVVLQSEDQGTGRMKVDGFSTSGSTCKYNRSDDADESFAPTSELDCYSTWNSITKMVNGNIDSSEIEASSEHHIEMRSRGHNVAMNLFKRIISKHEQRMHEEMPTKVSGRFRVSIIKEEEVSSRRGSASSNETMSKVSTFKDAPTTENTSETGECHTILQLFGNDTCFDNQVTVQADGRAISRDSADAAQKVNKIECLMKSEEAGDKNGTIRFKENKTPTLLDIAESVLRTNENHLNKDANGSVSDDKIEIGSFSDDMTQQNGCKKMRVLSSTDSGVECLKSQQSITGNGDSEITLDYENGFNETEEKEQSNTQSNKEKDFINQDNQQNDENITRNSSDHINNISGTNGFSQTADTILKGISGRENFLSVFGVNGNFFTDTSIIQNVKSRSVSPSPAVLGTYDVIPEVSTVLLDDYDILSDKRE